MPLLVRKFELAKWNQNKILEGEHASADAITGCTRTSSNSLSVWSISEMDELKEAVLAIASGLQRPDTLDFLIIETALIEDSGLIIDDKGKVRTPYHAFEPKHRDIIKLNYSSLGTMANIIIDHIRHSKWVRFRVKEIKALILDGIRDGKVQVEDLHEDLKKKLFPPPTAN